MAVTCCAIVANTASTPTPPTIKYPPCRDIEKSMIFSHVESAGIWEFLNLDHTNPHRFRKNHSTPNRPTKSSKNGQVSQ